MIRLRHPGSVASIALAFAALSFAHRSYGNDAPTGVNGVEMEPADTVTQSSLLKFLLSKNDQTRRCGSNTFYPWFAETVSFGQKGQSPQVMLRAASGSFPEQSTRTSFAKASQQMATLIQSQPHPAPYPSTVTSRRHCSVKKGRPNVEFSRPYRVGNMVFLEQREVSRGGRMADILALEMIGPDQWRLRGSAPIYLAE